MNHATCQELFFGRMDRNHLAAFGQKPNDLSAPFDLAHVWRLFTALGALSHHLRNPAGFPLVSVRK